MKGKHYNIITTFVPYKNIIIHPHNKIFTIFINYLLPILLATYCLSYILIIYYLTYLLLTTTYPTYHILPRLHTYLLLNLPNKLIS